MITRSLPVNSTVVIRSALFGLAKIGATLQTYSENAGFILATMGRYKVGPRELLQEEIRVSVKGYEGVSVLTIAAPEKTAVKLLNLISAYIVEGKRAIQEDAHIQWAELCRREERQRKKEEKRKALKQKVSDIKGKLPFFRPAERALLALEAQSSAIQVLSSSEEAQADRPISPSDEFISSEGGVIVLLEPAKLQVGTRDQLGMLIKDQEGNFYEIQIDPLMCDRTSYLVRCFFCSTINLQGGDYCSKCGKPLTVGVAQREVVKEIIKNARAGLYLAVAGFVPALLWLIITVVPIIAPGFALLIRAADWFLKPALGPTMLVLMLFAFPAFLLGLLAVMRARQAQRYSDLNIYAGRPGRVSVIIGKYLGAVDIYVGLGILIISIAKVYQKFIESNM